MHLSTPSVIFKEGRWLSLSIYIHLDALYRDWMGIYLILIINIISLNQENNKTRYLFEIFINLKGISEGLWDLRPNPKPSFVRRV